MVDKIFFITGQNIFDIALRPALIQMADEVGIKVHATNLRDKNQVRVVASGIAPSVQTFYDNVSKKEDLPHTLEEPDYTVDEIKDYDGPEIDWSAYNQQFMSAQLAKSASFFASLDKRMNLMHEDIKKLSREHETSET